ncbi:hypothetical protein [Paractinoplanes atraurantiacus]|uniref:Uncharacterized protein n=1 Tax=Paractinoplanes atraurantiacus TaxID=1036182 RepID=A0A285IJA5_9ACTN|nr:hypothetical protein [Actinoplanes atraurantiacus]SNY48034.1 hypothetical protein SAMN05421748_108274 [Actinoplanes atraurantiacus]
MNIDAASLPSDVVDLIDALQPGDELVVTRAGVPIATITGNVVLPRRSDIAHPSPGRDDVTVVATAMKLPEPARASLSERLGTGYIVVDMQAAPETTDVLLVPPVSPQLVGCLRSMFPRARVVVTEIEDDDLGVHYLGPIRRMLDAGAETYLTSTTIPSLAAQLDQAVMPPSRPTLPS